MPRPRLKRLLRISLRMVLLLTTVFCIWVAVKVHRVNQQKEAVAWVTGVGGTVSYDYEIGNPAAWNPPGPDWLRKLLGIDYFATVNVVELPYDTTDISPLANLSNLEYLLLSETQVSDLTPLAQLTELKYLDLWETPVNDLSPLASLTKLETLYLNGTQVSDLSPLEDLTELEVLGLSDSAIQKLPAMDRLTNLKEVDLRGTCVSNEDVVTLRKVLPYCRFHLWPDQ